MHQINLTMCVVYIAINLSNFTHAAELNILAENYLETATEFKSHVEKNVRTYELESYLARGVSRVSDVASIIIGLKSTMFLLDKFADAAIYYGSTYDDFMNCSPHDDIWEDFYNVSPCGLIVRFLPLLPIPILYYVLIPIPIKYTLQALDYAGMKSVQLSIQLGKYFQDISYQKLVSKLKTLGEELNCRKLDFGNLSLQERKNLFKAASFAGHLYLMYSVLNESGDAKEEISKHLPEAKDWCPICLEDWESFESYGHLLKTKCGHVFHAPCIEVWQKTQNDFCPCCKSQGMELTDLSLVWPEDL
jgi:RING finger family protein